MARVRRLAFGEVAELYDEARPSYPAALVDDVMELAGAGSEPPRALEVGAGTGKATVLFASRGASVLALEPSRAMAAIWDRNCAALPNVAIEPTDFEHWRPGEGGFAMVYSAQAWHWVSPELRHLKARAVLDEGGLLAAFWNRPDWDPCAVRTEIDDVYRSTVPAMLADGPMHPSYPASPDVWSNWESEIAAAPGLAQAEVRSYRWQCEYSSAEYVSLLQTHSDHILLETDRREALLDGVAAVIDRHGGALAIEYVTRLCLARAQ